MKQAMSEQARRLKQYEKKVKAINALEPRLQQLSDEDLKAETIRLKERVTGGTPIEDIAIEAFALVREASVRTLGMRHYDVQLIGGLALLEGHIAEMATGEGKTLVASLPSFTQALLGKGVHVITVNDYLARRDVEQIGKIHRFLGLSVGLNVPEISPDEKRAAYASDITYGVGTEFGFDYLRDHLVTRASDRVQRPFHFAIIDEVDSILIDEAKTPLIMAAKANVHEGLQRIVRSVVKTFERDEEFTLDEEIKAVALTDKGIETVEARFGIDNLFAAEHQVLYHYVVQALRAHAIFARDVDYIVKDGKIELIDLFTGRIMGGRSLSDGLHQAIEAKEGIEVTEENKTTAQVTIQHYFRMYPTISGMTGTAQTSRQEFLKTYGMDVVQVPPNRPRLRTDAPDLVFMTKQAKYTAVAQATKDANATGQPVLIGTTSIEQSMQVAQALDAEKLTYEVLNAKTVDQETDIIASAGQLGKITIATNMAGRGTDIVLGEGVEELGGLFVLGTERHESVRIDNQLRGRSGRQGDPGHTAFYISLEDDLVRRFAKDRLEKFLKRNGQHDGPVSSKEAANLVSFAQETCEGTGYSVREQLVKLDEGPHQHPLVINDIRNRWVDSTEIQGATLPMIEKTIHRLIDGHVSDDLVPEEWYVSELLAELQHLTGRDIIFPADATTREEVKLAFSPLIAEITEQAAAQMKNEAALELVRHQLLLSIEEHWTEHLTTMNTLKEGIHLRGYGQEDPSRVYEKEGLEIFNYTYGEIEYQVVHMLSRLEEYLAFDVEETDEVSEIEIKEEEADV